MNINKFTDEVNIITLILVGEAKINLVKQFQYIFQRNQGKYRCCIAPGVFTTDNARHLRPCKQVLKLKRQTCGQIFKKCIDFFGKNDKISENHIWSKKINKKVICGLSLSSTAVSIGLWPAHRYILFTTLRMKLMLKKIMSVL